MFEDPPLSWSDNIDGLPRTVNQWIYCNVKMDPIFSNNQFKTINNISNELIELELYE